MLGRPILAPRPNRTFSWALIVILLSLYLFASPDLSLTLYFYDYPVFICLSRNE